MTRKTLKSIIGDKNKDDDSNGDDDDNCDIDSDIEVVAREIRSIKEIMGLIERSDEYSAHLRDDIAKLLRKNNLLLASQYKRYLGNELLWNKEPPEYEEAIGLLEEASEGLERILGPSHKDVAEVNGDLAEAKEACKKHLVSNDSSKDDNAGRKRKRDGQE